MSSRRPVPDGRGRREITSRKVVGLSGGVAEADDSLTAWTQRDLDLTVRGVRSGEVTGKIARHLQRFASWFTAGLGHDRVSAVTPARLPRGETTWPPKATSAATAP